MTIGQQTRKARMNREITQQEDAAYVEARGQHSQFLQLDLLGDTHPYIEESPRATRRIHGYGELGENEWVIPLIADCAKFYTLIADCAKFYRMEN